MANKLNISTLLLTFLALGQAWSPPEPKGVTTLNSSYIEGASISYKKTDICSSLDTETYSGYVRLPPREDDAIPHPSNLFFYYARSNGKNHAPLTIYLSGGPGASSVSSMTTEIGPCSINPDSNSTSANPWSWTNESDILFIDQPIQTGFSYDVLTNSTIDYSTTEITPADFDKDGFPAVNHTFNIGVFGSQDLNGTVNSTANGARTLWDFMQVWINEFPEQRPDERKIHFWTESFGGRYGPSYSSYFLKQNEKIRNGQSKVDRVSSPSQIKLETLSIHNGCSDIVTQGSFYPEFAYNNTYGVQVITKQQYEEVKHNYTKPGGCLEMVMQCREQAQKYDPHNFANNAEVNAICAAADVYCYENVLSVYILSGRDIHDLAEIPTTTVPEPYTDGFFNQAWVREGLGAEVNFTSNSNAVYNAFRATGNGLISRGNAMNDFAYLLEQGVKVNFIHGDRDYLCNWMGGENITLYIKHEQSEAFISSGYEYLITNSTYAGGVVRQHGHLSFTRVFEAGHEAPAFQPETMYRVFSRIINSKDIATGDISLTGERSLSYRTRGPQSSFYIKNKLQDMSQPLCYTLDMSTTCTPDQKAALLNGTAIVKEFVVLWP